MLKKGDKIGIVGCSNGQPVSKKPRIEELIRTLKKIGLDPVCSNFIYETDSIFSGTGKERGLALMDLFMNPEVKAIFDISGGNVANEILEYLDYDKIKDNPKPFFGYSDLTTIINAIYAKLEIPTYLYQIRNLIYHCKEQQLKWFTNTLMGEEDDLFDIKYFFLQGTHMDGIVIDQLVKVNDFIKK
jgi:muramoyltetrapeptide carboxypeptidase LdcA involved in peptidoglycan recycling